MQEMLQSLQSQVNEQAARIKRLEQYTDRNISFATARPCKQCSSGWRGRGKDECDNCGSTAG